MIAIGGATESLYSTPATMDLVLRRRTGFVRVALQTGASLVPVINFGENELYNTVRGRPKSGLRKFQMYASLSVWLVDKCVDITQRNWPCTFSFVLVISMPCLLVSHCITYPPAII